MGRTGEVRSVSRLVGIFSPLLAKDTHDNPIPQAQVWLSMTTEHGEETTDATWVAANGYEVDTLLDGEVTATADAQGQFQIEVEALREGEIKIRGKFANNEPYGDWDTLDALHIEIRPEPETGFYETLYPNPLPSGSALTVPIAVDGPESVVVTVLDGAGGVVASYDEDYQAEGYHEIRLLEDIKLSGGTYTIRFSSDAVEDERTLIAEDAHCGCSGGGFGTVGWALGLVLFYRRRPGQLVKARQKRQNNPMTARSWAEVVANK